MKRWILSESEASAPHKPQYGTKVPAPFPLVPTVLGGNAYESMKAKHILTTVSLYELRRQTRD
jgi:hypothetical protein